MQNGTIKRITAREILDSRGNPTLAACVELEGGLQASAAVPSGASTGKYEAYELRDGDAARYGGKGVRQAVENVERVISPALVGYSVFDQRGVDMALCELDGSEGKRRLGANAILGVSLAVAVAAARAQGIPLWKWLHTGDEHRMPVPMMNVLNGGAHADNGLDVQEFMIVPLGASCFAEGVRMGSEIYHTLGKMLKAEGFSTGVGDEGGYAPRVATTDEALSFLTEAIHRAGYTTGEVKISLDVAASEWQTADGYFLPKSKKRMSRDQLIDRIQALTEKFPIFSVEDPLGEDDWQGFEQLTKALGDRMTIVGDDLFVTNAARLEEGIKRRAANAILIKPNQIGTLTEVLDVIAMAKAAGYAHILSHRSGETEDTFIADLAVATAAPLIKSGAPCRSERVAKYNRLLAIEAEMTGEREYGLSHR